MPDLNNIWVSCAEHPERAAELRCAMMSVQLHPACHCPEKQLGAFLSWSLPWHTLSRSWSPGVMADGQC